MFGLVVVTLLAASERDRGCEGATKVWEPLQLPAPCTILRNAKPATHAKLLREAWKLDDAQAACAAEAIAAIDAAPHRFFTHHPPPNPWLPCVQRFPTVLAFWPPVFGYDEPHRVLAEPVSKLAASEGGQLALEKLVQLDRAPSEVVLTIFHASPASLLRLLALEHLSNQVRGELAAAAVDERSAQLSREEWAALTAPLMTMLLERQSVLLAAEYFKRLPSDEQQRFAAARDELADTHEGKRVMLAIGLVALGEKDVARSIQIDPPSEWSEDGIWREVLDFLLTGKRASTPWDAAVSAAEVRGGSPELISAALPYFAGAETLPLAEMERKLEWLAERDSDFSEPFARKIQTARDRALKKLPRRAPQNPAPASGAVTVPEPLPSPWAERSTKWSGKSNPTATATLPEGFWAVRVEKQGSRIVALATSQMLDPVGEVGPGGYWLLLSNDRGSTWHRTYLGLGVHHPFSAYKTSKVPLIDGKDVVRLDLEDAPLDEASITFPPIALSTTTRRTHVILEASLAKLDEDFDHDGLSNLAEARLLLDPKKPDTDGDGFLDGDDFTPRLDDRVAPTLKAEMLNAFLEHFGSGANEPEAVVLDPNRDGGVDLGRPRAPTLDDVHFLVGTPEELAGVKPLGTFITLSKAELELARARYGTFYPMGITVTVADNDHAYVRWNNSWSGGSARIDRDKTGKLVVTGLGEWSS